MRASDQMDFITHTLLGAGVARLVSPRRELLPQVSLAAIGGSLLQDGDSWLYLIDPSFYGKYHRVGSHNVWALALIGLLAAGIAWLVSAWPRARRFGWFVSDNLPPDVPLPRATYRLLAIAGVGCAYLHFAADTITGFGNVLPFWPFSSWDSSMHAVSSFDVVIFCATIAWFFTARLLNWSRPREAVLTACYFVVMAAYVLARWKFGEPSII